MKKLVHVEELQGQGFEALLGKKIAVWCLNYIYAGTLIGASDHDIILEGAKVVYETGDLEEKGFQDAQPLPGKEWRIRTGAIESYGEME